jgi:hypothetical protein
MGKFKYMIPTFSMVENDENYILVTPGYSRIYSKSRMVKRKKSLSLKIPYRYFNFFADLPVE